jgi:hypothetical protein
MFHLVGRFGHALEYCFLVSYCNDVASVVVRNCQGYFNETWCEDTFGQYAQSFFDFCDLENQTFAIKS